MTEAEKYPTRELRWRWWRFLDQFPHRYAENQSLELVRYGIRTPEQMNNFSLLLDYAEYAGLLNKQECKVALDLGFIWIMEPERRKELEPELLMAVPWKLLAKGEGILIKNPATRVF